MVIDSSVYLSMRVLYSKNLLFAIEIRYLRKIFLNVSIEPELKILRDYDRI